jgi:O-antigen/teichoic acid export membrane protein
MNPIKKNLAANIISYTFTPAATLVCVPLFKKYLGIEAFGLIGFFVTIYSVLTPLCAGLNMAMNREMARLSAHESDWPQMRDLVRTLEIVYWGVTLLMGMAVILASPLLAGYWLKAQELPVQTVRHALLLMGATLTLQFPNTLYTAAFNGLQRQVYLAAVNMTMNGLRLAGTVLVIWRVSPTIEAFFLCQIVFGGVHTLVLRVLLIHLLPKTGRKPAFSKIILKRVWKFTAGTAGISVAAIVLTQTDKIVIISNGGEGAGASKITADVTNIVSQVPALIEALTGINLVDSLQSLPGIGQAKQKPPAEK